MVFPPMPTKRHSTTAVTTRKHLIVAGGATTIVEVMDTETRLWSTTSSLPQPCSWGSATICGDQLYILGGVDHKGRTKSVPTCSLTELLQSSSLSSSVWHRVADAPAYGSTCAAVNGELLAVDGHDERNETTGDIHKYNKTTNSWELTSNMPTARSCCLVAILPTNEMMVISGIKSMGSLTDILEFANISFSQLFNIEYYTHLY